MPTVVRMQYALPDAQFLNNLLTDDLILRYVKDDYENGEQCIEFYDTRDWMLAASGFSLGVTRSQEIPVSILNQGKRQSDSMPGLYTGIEWIAPFTDLAHCVSLLRGRGAPEALETAIGHKPLTRCFYTISRTKSTTLYLPDRTRIDMTFDNGELVAENKRQPVYALYLELLYGDKAPLFHYCHQLSDHFQLSPVLLSRHQQALRLLRSR